MKRTPGWPWALELLDDGLRLYRRNLPVFALVGAVVLVPMAILTLLFNWLVETELGSGWTVLGGVLLAIVQYPVWLYACVGLSRTAALVLDARPVKIGQVLRIGPLRAAGMGCYGLFFTMITGLVFGTVYMFVVCPLFYAVTFGSTLLGAIGGGGTLGAAGGLFIVITAVSVLSGLLLYAATLASLAYAVQAWALERRSFSASLSRSVDLVTYRLGRNLIVFLGAGAIAGTLLVIYAATLIGAGAALFQLLDINLSPPVRSALIQIVTTASYVVLLPPVPIWMAMLHRAIATERDGMEIAAAVEGWHAAATARQEA